MNEQLKQQLHLQLQQMYQSLLAQIAAETNDTQVVELDQSRLGRLSRMDALQGQQMGLEAARRKQHQLQVIEGALLRINSDEYGECFVCGEDIDLNRLKFDPTVTRCIHCAQT
ncbi:TraR/DksA C4-type zinc finger protein [Shewanella profunda]|uniref:TraR/DksA family transcriptional regulator n=1 Tax=Shewanella profunda TaxID=254793 RepID=UPI00200E6A7D|nr:TraR/DksA C4-type zinc finger protein [Shewanella profunda]MCL1089120.1 TraR/DksA C4-type zinc finger protein [Shewanella profunda]